MAYNGSNKNYYYGGWEMNELQAQLDEVNAQITEEQAKGAQRDQDILAGLETKQAAILLQMDAEKARLEQEAAQQVRIQAQGEKVDSITLPFDFNDIFENAKANDMIIEVVKEFQRKAYEDHNTEIQTLTGGYKEVQRASQEYELEMKRQYMKLQDSFEKERQQAIIDAAEHSSLLQQIAQLQLDKQDADSKRDAAVKQLEEAQAEITQLKQWNDDLRAQAAHGVRKAIDIIDISPSEKLALMVKETNEQKANRALTRWSEIMPEVVAPPVVPAGTAVFQPGDTQAGDNPTQLEQTASQPISEVGAVDSFRTEEIRTVPTAMVEGISSTNGSQTEAPTVTRYEFEALKADVEVLKRRNGMVA